MLRIFSICEVQKSPFARPPCSGTSVEDLHCEDELQMVMTSLLWKGARMSSGTSRRKNKLHTHDVWTIHAHTSYTHHAHTMYTHHAHPRYIHHAYTRYTHYAHTKYTHHAYTRHTHHAHTRYHPCTALVVVIP